MFSKKSVYANLREQGRKRGEARFRGTNEALVVADVVAADVVVDVIYMHAEVAFTARTTHGRVRNT